MPKKQGSKEKKEESVILKIPPKAMKEGKGPQTKHWCFTLYNVKKKEFDEILMDERIHYIKAQEEICPETKRDHIQGYIIFKKKQYRSIFYTLTGQKPHCNPCWSGEGSFTYCMKEESRKPEGGIWNTMPKEAIKKDKRPLFQITELRPHQKQWYDIFLSEPEPRGKLYWWWEATGNIGKSVFVNYLIDNHPNEMVFFDGGDYKDLMMVISETNMDQVRAIVWDMPRETRGKISTRACEAMMSMRIRSMKYEGGFKRFAPVHIMVFSNNYPISDIEDTLSSDRWVIEEIKT